MFYSCSWNNSSQIVNRHHDFILPPIQYCDVSHQKSELDQNNSMFDVADITLPVDYMYHYKADL